MTFDDLPCMAGVGHGPSLQEEVGQDQEEEGQRRRQLPDRLRRRARRPAPRPKAAGGRQRRDRRQDAVHAGQRYKNDRNLYGGNLQKAIKGAGSVDEILDMVADNASFLDHIHCVTAVYKMAKLTQTSRKGRGRGRGGQGGGGANAAVRVDLLTDQRFEVLKVAIEGQINKFDSWVRSYLLRICLGEHVF